MSLLYAGKACIQPRMCGEPGPSLVSPEWCSLGPTRAAFQTTQDMDWIPRRRAPLFLPLQRTLVTSVRPLIVTTKRDACDRTSGTAQRPELLC